MDHDVWTGTGVDGVLLPPHVVARVVDSENLVEMDEIFLESNGVSFGIREGERGGPIGQSCEDVVPQVGAEVLWYKCYVWWSSKTNWKLT